MYDWDGPSQWRRGRRSRSPVTRQWQSEWRGGSCLRLNNIFFWPGIVVAALLCTCVPRQNHSRLYFPTFLTATTFFSTPAPLPEAQRRYIAVANWQSSWPFHCRFRHVGLFLSLLGPSPLERAKLYLLHKLRQGCWFSTPPSHCEPAIFRPHSKIITELPSKWSSKSSSHSLFLRDSDVAMAMPFLCMEWDCLSRRGTARDAGWSEISDLSGLCGNCNC